MTTTARIFRRLAGLLGVIGFMLTVEGESPPAAAHEAVVNKHCVFCHNEKLKTGGLALDTIASHGVDENPEIWEKVVRKLRGRQMPPLGMPRPDEATYEAAIASLESSLDALASDQPDPGRTETFRRLNRTEYRNAIRDLLALDVDVSSLLPSDQSSYGFDNITVGTLSPMLMDRYVSAAQKISRLAVGRSGSPGGYTLRIPPDVTQSEHVDGLPIGTRGGALVPYTFPVDGGYEVELSLQRDSTERIAGLREAHEVEVTLDRERVKLFTVQPPGASGSGAWSSNQDADKHLKIRLPVEAGPHTLGVAFLKKPSALLRQERQPYNASYNSYRHPRTQPALYSISITGPFDVTGPGDTPSRDRIFVCQPADRSEEDGCARRILTTLMGKAYRRPVTDAEIGRPFELYREARAEEGFDAGIEMALSAILVSPEFLFRIEQEPAGVGPNEPYRISDLELASRLSFFLWSSIPDQELLDVAGRGDLGKPPVFEQQVHRMLVDSRASNLVTNFASQWLHLRNLASTTPDKRLFADFDDNLRQAFRRETELFFESIMREDRSVLELLTANYTFLNERLAKHYGIPHVYGDRFRRVPLAEDSYRGGLLRQGSILTVTSYATRTSPVIRGKWILDNILGVPPPPPPANVPELEEQEGQFGKVESMRQRLSEHRQNPACASCHNLMDPVGFAFENYDAIGRWRTRDGGLPVDASGKLFDGSEFDGLNELQQALLARPQLFVNRLTEKLLVFATGRGVEYYDAPAIRQIVREAARDDYRFSSLVLGVTKSQAFQMRRSSLAAVASMEAKPKLPLGSVHKPSAELGSTPTRFDSSIADAAERMDEATIRSLLQRGFDVNAAQVDGMTGLHWAAYYDDLKMVTLLLRAGSDVTVANRYEVTPLSLSCTNGNAAIIKVLLNAGADPNAALRGGETPLMTAARTGRVEAVRALLASGAQVEAKERGGQTAFMWAAAEGHADVVEALMQAGADFRSGEEAGWTPMFFAVRQGRMDVVKTLLKAGVDVNETVQRDDPNLRLGYRGRVPRVGASALHIAVTSAHYELAAYLLDAGADPNSDSPGYTVLHSIANVRKPGVGNASPAPDGSGNMTSVGFIRKIVEQGADVNARMTKQARISDTRLHEIGATPFMMASQTADAEFMRLLAELGADPLLTNEENSTPLMAAAGLATRSPGEDAGTEPEVLEAVQVAIDLGADVDAVDDNGETVMHSAAYKNFGSVVTLLAKNGANIEVWNKKNKWGWTPLSIAAGYRFGNFKPSPGTVAALHESLIAAGVSPPKQVAKGLRCEERSRDCAAR